MAADQLVQLGGYVVGFRQTLGDHRVLELEIGVEVGEGSDLLGEDGLVGHLH